MKEVGTCTGDRRPRGRYELVLFGILLLELWILYGLMGHTQGPKSGIGSALRWMVDRWSGSGGDLSHGWLIPIVSAVAIWRRRKELASAEKTASMAGLVVILLSLMLYVFGVRAQLTRLSLLSLIGLLWGIPLYLYGRRVAALLLFPCAYLVFCIPLSFLSDITVPLRIFVSTISAALLNGVGIQTERVGTIIASSVGGGFHFNVADPCSGLRSLLALSAIAAAYAHFAQKGLLRKLLLFAASVTIAMIGNISRILVVALIAASCGQEFAQGVYEQASGLIVFAVAVLLMIATGNLLNAIPSRKLREWKPVDKED